MGYTVGKLAKMAGLSVRALHHYDSIGLLRPRSRPGSGYREYGEAELERLQRILFYRELDFPLAEIGRMLDDPAREGIEALREQKELLAAKARRLSRLIGTIDRTIARMGGEEGMTDEEMFEGFAPEKREAIRKETEERWGGKAEYAESRRRLKKMTKDEFKAVLARGEGIEAGFAEAFRRGEAPGSAAAQALAQRWIEHLRAFYEPKPEILRGLGELYAGEGEFRDRYEALAPGLAAWLKEVMGIVAGRMVENRD